MLYDYGREKWRISCDRFLEIKFVEVYEVMKFHKNKIYDLHILFSHEVYLYVI